MTDPVLVVGLGPVGATVALLLAAQGVTVVAVERDAEPYPHARAVALDDEALRVLQAAGVRHDLALRSGNTVRLRGRGGVPLVDVPPAPVDTGHPALAFFHQPQLEDLLRARLRDEPLVDVRLGTELVGLREDHGAVRATVRPTGHGAAGAQEIRAAYVVGCDGGRSAVRRLLGIPLVGRTAGSRWLVVDTRRPPPAADGTPFVAEDFEFGCDPRRPWVHGPLPGDAHRWEFMLDAREPSARLADPAVVAGLVSARLGHAPAPEVLRAAVYTFHARIARTWRRGRVLLAGDAAHLAPPFAGQGLGAGLRDAHHLAWRVAAVVQGRASDALLDSYARERLPHVARMTALAAAMGAVVQTRRPRVAAARDLALRALLRSARTRGWVDRGGWKPPSRIGRSGLVGRGPRAGELLPQPTLRRGDAGVPLDDVLGPGPVLLAVGHVPELAVAARAAALGVRCVTVTTDGPGEEELAAWLAPGRIALVRPDRVVFAAAVDPRDADALLTAFATALARPAGRR